MWMSKNLARQKYTENDKAEKGCVTMSSNELEAGATVINRGVENYVPYGYQCSMPVGEEVMLIPSDNGQAVIGTLSKPSNRLSPGEIKISSRGGACIILRNDGSIELNSLVIDRNGVILDD
ncbi:hypothetical protein [uncultured Eubacterium sp.]|uniref:hypothetical protein n=1 Tax=uncultured Eubacterium sp. TaxID=165185 RepID=UPI0015B2B335|nr:hypothetical protein [uncultured Eubacterium sp.]DAL36924.1 MAG TPA_asm: hypothetical protein [Caudoviricetes sp.]